MTNPLNIILTICVCDNSNIGSSLVAYIFHKFNNQPIPCNTLELRPLNYPKLLKLTLSALYLELFSMDHHQTWWIKLSDNICLHNLSATFNNQPDLMTHFWSYGPYLAELALINIVHFVFKYFSMDHHKTGWQCLVA